MESLVRMADRGLLPDSVIRFGIRRLLRARLREQERRSKVITESSFLELLRTSPIAVAVDQANGQHYEVPAEFFRLVLGPRLKYSSAYWPYGVSELEDAERAMLHLTVERAQIEDGMKVLDLGCGWGSVSLWIAERFPRCSVLAVSNSASQRECIRKIADANRLDNLEVVTSDINDFEPGRRFDRVVSVEMLEHVRNYEALLRRVRGWLTAEGRFFVHIFCHRRYAYLYEVNGDNDWMARHFFTGGTMPSEDLLRKFDRDLAVESQWRVGGQHYEKTLRAWLARLDAKRDRARSVLAPVYGEENVDVWVERWRIFFLACAELFGFRSGNEWSVAHYLLAPSGAHERKR